MNVKNLNLLERHVEKIILAVAAAGALYIGYLAIQPIYVPGTEIKAGEVESQVTSAIDSLKAVRSQTAARKDISAQMLDYVQQYQDIMMKQPLPPDLTAVSAVPPFAPLQQPVGVSGVTAASDVFGPTEVVAPSVPAPRNVTAVSTLATIIAPADASSPPPVPASPGTPAAGTTKDANWVTISGDFPMGEFIAAMNSPSLQQNQKLPSSVQHAAIYRIEVQRRSRGNGSWSAWESVPSPNQDTYSTDWSKVSDTDLPGVVSTLENALPRIAEPAPHTLANGQLAIPPVLQKEAETAVPPKPVVPASPKPTAAVDTATPAPAAPATPAVTLPEPNSLHSLANIPFWVFDEHVTPGSEYQYQVRVVMYNPTYRYPGVKDQKMKATPTLASDWYTVPGTVEVSEDTYFFVNNNLGNGGGGGNVLVGFRVYKWTNGKWYGTEWTVQPGMPISGKITVKEKDQPNKVIDAQTGYSLVDALPGTEMRAILLSPTGELVTRSSTIDDLKTNAKRQEVQKDYEETEKEVAPPPPPPAPKPVPRPDSGSSVGQTQGPNTGRNSRNPDLPP